MDTRRSCRGAPISYSCILLLEILYGKGGLDRRAEGSESLVGDRTTGRADWTHEKPLFGKCTDRVPYTWTTREWTFQGGGIGGRRGS